MVIPAQAGVILIFFTLPIITSCYTRVSRVIPKAEFERAKLDSYTRVSGGDPCNTGVLITDKELYPRKRR